jgi:hypothetical protein
MKSYWTNSDQLRKHPFEAAENNPTATRDVASGERRAKIELYMMIAYRPRRLRHRAKGLVVSRIRAAPRWWQTS